MQRVKKYAELDECGKRRFWELMQEYLPDSDPDQARAYCEEYGEAYCAVENAEGVVGVIFGWPRRVVVSDDSSFSLDGIAVEEKWHRKGYGRLLIQAMEKAAALYHCDSISVGSAGGYVEEFYIANGFIPRTYKIYKDGAITVAREFQGMEDYRTYQRPTEDGFVVLDKPIGY